MPAKNSHPEAQELVAKLALARDEAQRELAKPLPKWPLVLIAPLSIISGVSFFAGISAPPVSNLTCWMLLALCLAGILACIDAALRYQRRRIEALGALLLEQQERGGYPE